MVALHKLTRGLPTRARRHLLTDSGFFKTIQLSTALGSLVKSSFGPSSLLERITQLSLYCLFDLKDLCLLKAPLAVR